MTSEKRAFILGMMTAFCECVAGGCKRLALSPPLKPAEYAEICEEAGLLFRKHGLLFAHETNPELPEEERFEWFLIAARQETLRQYADLRAEGYSPAASLKPFHRLLSYDPAQGVAVSYDAYREYFPMKE